MTNLNVPTRSDVSTTNQVIFDKLEKGIGFVPNLYATFAHSDTALDNYLTFQNAKSSLRAKEREIVNLVTSQVNGCRYCQSAHTVLGKMHGLTNNQMLEIRGGKATFNVKFDALAKLTKEIVISRGKPSQLTLENFFAVGYTKGNLVDVLVVIGDKIISNYLHNIGQFEIDFPIAQELELELEYA
ncbi:MAG: carboxymuconolactone decarboxylase family protein [Saprospiraceae bacterium]